MKSTLAVGVLGVALAAAALPAMAQPRPDHGPGRIQTRLFDQADTNKDGRVTEAELVEFLSVRFAEADADKDGAITPEELGRFVRAQFEANRPPPAAGRERREPSPRALQAMEERQATVFRIVDANRDGRVTLEEARVVVLAVFRAADSDGDGAIERDEMRGPRHRRGEARPATPPASPAPPAR